MTYTIGHSHSILHRYANTYMQRELETLGIPASVVQFFIPLYCKNGVSLDQLTQSLRIDKANTTRGIKKMTSLGLVYVSPDPEDGRVKRVYLTQKAHALKEEVHRIRTEWQTILLKDLSDEEINLLTHINHRLVENVLTFFEEDTK